MAKGVELRTVVMIGIVVVLILSLSIYFIFIRNGDDASDEDDDGNGEQPNRYPVADAGNDITVRGGETFYLNGSRSSDIDGDALTYSWDLDISTDANNDGAPDNDYFKRGVNISHSYPVPEEDVEYIVQLNVSDGKLWDTSTVKVLVLAVEQEPPEITMSCRYQVFPFGLSPQFILTIDSASRNENFLNFSFELEDTDGEVIREGAISDLLTLSNESEMRYIDNPLSNTGKLDQGDFFDLNENEDIVEGCTFIIYYLNFRDPCGSVELEK